MNLEGKVVIVTGGASGIGLSCVKKFLAEGSKVVIGDYSDNGEEVLKELNNPNVQFMRMDVRKEEHVKLLVSKTVEIYGKLDVMVANAGVGDGGLLADCPTESFDNIVSINLRGVFLCNKYAIQEMLKTGGGSIVNISSILGIVGEALAPAYCSCKGGVSNMTRSAALGYATKNIRVNAVAPGYIYTPMIEAAGSADNYQGLISKHPIGRLGEADEVADAVLFLSGDQSTFITGVILPVDGGYTAI